MNFRIVLLLLFSPFCMFGQNISSTGNWSYNVPASTISEAGNNYNGNISSNVNQTLLDLAGMGFYTTYRVDVRHSGTLPAPLTLQVMRTGDGVKSGFGGISGGTAYQNVTNSNIQFFTGWNFLGGTYMNVPIQYNLTGVSVLIPAGSYATTVTYTIIAI